MTKLTTTDAGDDKPKKYTKREIERLFEKLKKALNNWVDGTLAAGQAYVELQQAAPEKLEKVKELFAYLPPVLWADLEKVGNGVLHHVLVRDASATGECLRRLPFSQQTQVMEKGAEMLTADGSTLIVHPMNMTSSIRKQLFHKGAIRDKAAQRAYLEAQKLKVSVKRGQCLTPRLQIGAKGEMVFPDGSYISKAEAARSMTMNYLLDLMKLKSNK